MGPASGLECRAWVSRIPHAASPDWNPAQGPDHGISLCHIRACSGEGPSQEHEGRLAQKQSCPKAAELHGEPGLVSGLSWLLLTGAEDYREVAARGLSCQKSHSGGRSRPSHPGRCSIWSGWAQETPGPNATEPSIELSACPRERERRGPHSLAVKHPPPPGRALVPQELPPAGADRAGSAGWPAGVGQGRAGWVLGPTWHRSRAQ